MLFSKLTVRDMQLSRKITIKAAQSYKDQTKLITKVFKQRNREFHSKRKKTAFIKTEFLAQHFPSRFHSVDTTQWVSLSGMVASFGSACRQTWERVSKIASMDYYTDVLEQWGGY